VLRSSTWYICGERKINWFTVEARVHNGAMIQGDDAASRTSHYIPMQVKDFEWLREQDVEDCSNS
jgi:hypothetical protein